MVSYFRYFTYICIDVLELHLNLVVSLIKMNTLICLTFPANKISPKVVND